MSRALPMLALIGLTATFFFLGVMFPFPDRPAPQKVEASSKEAAVSTAIENKAKCLEGLGLTTDDLTADPRAALKRAAVCR